MEENFNRPPVPAWLKDIVRHAKRRDNIDIHSFTSGKVAGHKLHTVCDGARCPNKGSCYSHGTATFLILGDTCTRNCRFCAVNHGCPGIVDTEEPRRLAQAAEEMKLSHVVVTSVTRDDLPDGGAAQFAATIRELHALSSRPDVEVLVPDFNGDVTAVETVLVAKPAIFAHNVEMAPRLYNKVRPGAIYERSLHILAHGARVAAAGTAVKSGFMVGLGEERNEIEQILSDLKTAGVTMVTIGQYLAPTMSHYPVQRYVTPAEFDELASIAKEFGFASVAAGPLVRSSYHAGEYYQEMQNK